jgi:hypothetical protein
MHHVDHSNIGPGPLKYRQDSDPLWRRDTRPPKEIFKSKHDGGGFHPRVESPHTSDVPHTPTLHDWINKNEWSSYLSTTRDPKLKWTGKYLYKINTPTGKGIDLEATLGNDYPPEHRHEQEVMFPGGVDPQFIEGAYRVFPSGPMGKWITPIPLKYAPNPFYNGGRAV